MRDHRTPRRSRLLCATLILCGLPFVGDATAAELPFLVGGTQVHESDSAHWTETLRKAGMNAVAVTVYARQGEWDDDALSFGDGDRCRRTTSRRPRWPRPYRVLDPGRSMASTMPAS